MGIVCARAGAQPWSRGCVGDCALLLYALLVVNRGCCDDVPCLSWTVSGHTRLVITYSIFREQAANCSRISNSQYTNNMIVIRSSNLSFNMQFHLIPKHSPNTIFHHPLHLLFLSWSPSLWGHAACSTLFLHSVVTMPLSFCVVAKFRVNDSAHDLVNVPTCGLLWVCSE